MRDWATEWTGGLVEPLVCPAARAEEVEVVW
jgi:hypothetical protein